MKKNRINKPSFIFIISLLIFSCEEPSSIDEPFPITEINFDYLQGSNKLYISAKVSQRYMNSSLDSVEVLWNGINASNSNDTLRLYDDGSEGDMLALSLIHI